ncbi:hypothetical protein EON82_17320 [bacterium]|nr:MAG: hypothetical protein EON82_17320 [bacterium]
MPRLAVQVVSNKTTELIPALTTSVLGLLTTSGSAGFDLLNGALHLTSNVPNSAGSMFGLTPVDVTSFSTSFTFKLNAPFSGGLAFVLHNNKTTAAALGGPGDRLGFGPDDKTGTPLRNAVAIKFDTNPNSAGGGNSTGLYSWASIPSEGGIDLTPSGIDLKSGHVFKADLDYDGETLTVTILDTVTLKKATQTYKVNIPQMVTGALGRPITPTAFVGFTGGAGSAGGSYDVLSWTFRN